MAVWMVRSSEGSDLEIDWLLRGFVSLGWKLLPDLSSSRDRQDIKLIYDEVYPGENFRAVDNRTGQIWIFVGKIKVDDIIAVPLKGQQVIAIGRVVNPYSFKRDNIELKHTIRVDWLNKALPKSKLDEDLLRSLGAFMTVCSIKRDDAEGRIMDALKDS